MVKKSLGLKIAAVPLLTAASLFVGMAGANAAPASPHSIGVPEWAHFGSNSSACMSTEALYQSEDAHILVHCYDPYAGTLGELTGVTPPDWKFEYQWT